MDAAIEDVNGKNEQVPTFNFDGFEQQQREIIIELKMRRAQLITVRKELDDEKLKSNQLKYTLDATKNCNKELESSMKMILESKNTLEEKYKSNLDAKNKACRQHDLTLAENRTLKERLQKAETEKCELTRVVEDLKSQHYCDEMNTNEMSAKITKFKEEIGQVAEQVKKAQFEQKALSEQSKVLGKFNGVLKSSKFYKEETDKIKQINIKLENELLYYKGKLEKLQDLIDNSAILPLSKESQFFLNEWRSTVASFKSQLQMQQDITSNLINNLNKEKEANVLLIQREILLTTKIEELKICKEVRSIETQTEIKEVPIELEVLKNEPIEIVD